MNLSVLHPAPVALSNIQVPRDYNAATWFIDRHLREGRGDRPAFIDRRGRHSYRALAERVNRAGNALLGLGLQPEQRVVMILPDTVDFPVLFWGAMKAGLIPVPLNPLLPAGDLLAILDDSRARALVADDCVLKGLADGLDDRLFLRHVVEASTLDRLLGAASPDLEAARTTADDVAFWLYSSGSTGSPKGVMHCQRHLAATAELYGRGVLGMGQDDVVFSAAKLFFAYGLGNGMTFPLHVGACAVLLDARPTPAAVAEAMKQWQPTLFFGVPTLFASMLAEPSCDLPSACQKLRLAVSAGEALPAELGRRWQDRTGVEVLDGLGSTEMLHIFLSNRPGAVRYGSAGTAVPGYEVRVVDEAGRDVAIGEVGELMVRGPSAAMAYWNRREASLRTFRGEWTYTGDQVVLQPDGSVVYAGRTDDMLKVSGIWVSPFEVESALAAHPAVLEAAIVGQADEGGMIKPKAYVVLKSGHKPDDTLAGELKSFVKERLAPHSYPRWIRFVEVLPKTATGKIQRFRLRPAAG